VDEEEEKNRWGYNKDEITQIVSYDFRHTTYREK
jgi:hypothetical protein